MFGEKMMIKKYPYLGYSSNLMEYFSIIGYEVNFLQKLVSLYKENPSNIITSTNNQALTKMKNSISPTILSSITSKIDFGIIDNELIISQLYPENPKIILVEVNQPEPSKSSVIYSFCFDSKDSTQKVFYTCYGYKFYEKFTLPNTSESYYIPKAFCIISQYPFFNNFYLICKSLHQSFNSNNNQVPLEVLIYNIVNFIPSPINYNLELNLFSHLKDKKKLQINQLNGYPNIDFDLYEIFNLLPLNVILKIYVLTFLEQSIIFFSSNLELLNIIMYIMYVLNYPCNDSTYFMHIVSVNKYSLIDENKFVGKFISSLLGVHSSYNKNINTFAFGSLIIKKLFIERHLLCRSMIEKNQVK